MSRAWIGGLWAMCVAVGGCFAEPDPVGDGTQDESGQTDTTGDTVTTAGASTSEPFTTTNADSTGSEDDSGSGSDESTTGVETTGPTGDSGGVAGELLFDFFDEACGLAVIRAVYTDAAGGSAIECGETSPSGVIDAVPAFTTATGPASRVVTMGLASASNASVGLETAMAVPIGDYQAAVFLAELDCGEMSTGSYKWFVSLPEVMGDSVPPVAMGVFECGAEREILQVMLPEMDDRAVAFAVQTEDAAMRLATLIDPIVVGLL